MSRTATISRTTSESSVRVELDLDGTGRSSISTGVGFYDHMLTTLSKHSLIDLTVETTGDVWIDAHHTVEDTSATKPVSGVSVMRSYRWTRLWPTAWWMSLVVPTPFSRASPIRRSMRSSVVGRRLTAGRERLMPGR